MRSSMNFIVASLLWSASLVHSAINLDLSQAVSPVTAEDPSPINDPNTYIPDQHDCPLPCADLANTHSWIPYFSIDRLRRCQEPMLLKFTVTRPLEGSLLTTLIRSCSLRPNVTLGAPASSPMENPKKAKYLFQPSLSTAPACSNTGSETQAELELATSGSTQGDSGEVANLLQGMQKYFGAKDNCDENFLFAFHKKTIASVYIGKNLGKATAESALLALARRLEVNGSVSERLVAQLCGSGRSADHIFGISVDTTGDLVAVHNAAVQWSKGNCALNGNLKSTGILPRVRIFDIASTNSTAARNTTSLTSWFLKRERKTKPVQLAKRIELVPMVPNADGTCKAHLIQDGDQCDKLATRYGVSIPDLEKWNKGKTWAWTECKNMLSGYNMCVSDGSAPLPPPQAGTECGPIVPGTQPPTDSKTSIADLNPCPLKACCSNWGFCGPFPAHCDIHAPPGGGPGSKLPGFQSTCISNCGNAIKNNSGPPATFQRIGYYSSFNLDRNCLWLKAKNANTDGSYTHIHWAFAEIDPATWKVVIKDTKHQWADFKALSNVKRIVSFGGWAYSTEPATYNIIRSAIIQNREAFASNLAQFVKDEGIDGVDIDWEYPGAPDILVNGQPIGQKTDGVDYLKFLTTLKNKIGSEKSVSIAAPASFWYLKAFPIDRIAAVINYIVFMTYDLHGQWDYGNKNAFDSCDSGKCIRSHVNLTETHNALSIITKAGVPNNKIFVGEASYGRSFHMAQDGCWGPMCDFTGSRDKSDALPGRCTATGGYVAYAEINEMIKNGGSTTFHDAASNTDIMLYKGDYISYMTPTTKNTRRSDWKGLNFAGSIDWALDLQSFGQDDMEKPGRPSEGTGCISGQDSTENSGDLCEFSCSLGFCPESLCSCITTGDLLPTPPETPSINIVAHDEFDPDLNRLCKFACSYGYCPDDICTVPPTDEEEDTDNFNYNEYYNYTDVRWKNNQKCTIFKEPEFRDVSLNMCLPVCQEILDEAKQEGRTSNYGCMGFFPLDKTIPWERKMRLTCSNCRAGGYYVADGQCLCDNFLINELADTIIEALPAIAQIGCYMLMSSLKLVLDIGADFIPGVGKALDAGLDMATVAAQTLKYIYPDKEAPEDAFSWWLSPCGGTNLVPDEIKKIFGILSNVADGISSFKPPKKIPKGSGTKGDGGNPRSPTKPRPTKPQPKPNNPNGVPKKKKCKITKAQETQRLGAAKNTYRVQSCVASTTQKQELIITSVVYAANAQRTQVVADCVKAFGQACYHYSSAIRVNPQWATLTCPPEAATTAHRENGRATAVWSNQHRGLGWLDKANRPRDKCDRDEYPPAYLLGPNDPAMLNSGVNRNGQLIRFLPDVENRKAGKMWKGACFKGPVININDRDFQNKIAAAPMASKRIVRPNGDVVQTYAAVTVPARPEFTISSWAHANNPAPNDGLNQNPCWARGIAAQDPGFALLTYDPFYNGQQPIYNYGAAYQQGTNGS